MSYITISTNNFQLSSMWRCSTGSNGQRFFVEGPTTVSTTKTFSFSLPKGAIIDRVRLFASIVSPFTGAAILSANDVGVDYTEDYTELPVDTLDVASGNFNVKFIFQANGQIFADSDYHAGTVAFSDVFLQIDYTIPNSRWSISTQAVDAGQSASIIIEPYDDRCSHELLVTFGANISETHTIEAGVSTYKLDVPLQWLYEIPNAVTGVATLKLKTIKDGEELGLSEPVSLTVNCPDSVKPSTGDLSVEIVDPVWGMCIQYHSSVKLLLKQCMGAYGSTVQYASLSSESSLGEYTSRSDSQGNIEFEFLHPLTSSGSITIQATVVDSRGRATTKSGVVQAQAYEGPSIKQVTQGRANRIGVADSQGTYAYANVVFSYSEIGENSVVAQISYRADGEEEWVLGYEGELRSGQVVLFGGDLSTSSVYEVKYVLSDEFSHTLAHRTISTAYAFMKWVPQSNAIGFGCTPRGANMLEVGPMWRMYAYGKDIESYNPVWNYVDNGYFIQPVNQRCFMEDVHPDGATLMYLDRWEITGIGSAACIGFENGVGLRMVGNSTQEYIEIRQRFEAYSDLAGHEFTFVCSVDGVEYYHSFVMGQVSAEQNIGKLGFYSTKAAHIALRNSTAEQINIEWIALYKGVLDKNTVPKYVPKGYGVEFVECSRYFARVGTVTRNWFGRQVYAGYYMTSNTALISIPSPNVLRTAPTIRYGAWDVEATQEDALSLYNADGIEVSIASVSCVVSQNGGVSMLITIEDDANVKQNSLAILGVNFAIHLSADV